MSLYGALSEDVVFPREGNVPAITVGVVTDINDPDKLGRVKVRLLNRSTSESETNYIRVMTAMSGAKWGVFFLPEVGDEVLVAFCDGDRHSPYVIGSLWNSKHTQPVQIKDKKNDVRMIKTKSGNTLSFTDTDGEETVELITAKKMKLSMQEKAQKITLQDKDGKNLLSIDGKGGNISVTADKKIELKAGSSKIILDGSGKISIESSGNVEIKGQQVKITAQSGLTLSAQATMDIKSSGQLNLQATGPANLKGAIVKLN